MVFASSATSLVPSMMHSPCAAAPAASGSGQDGSSSLSILLQAHKEICRREALAAAAAPPAAAVTAAGAAAAHMMPPLAPQTPAAPVPLAPLPPQQQQQQAAVVVAPPAAAAAPAREGPGMHVLGSMEGLRSGSTGARVGLLPGMRTAMMDKFNGELPKKKRAPPTDLSGLSAEERVERRKERARLYSRQSRERQQALAVELTQTVDGLALACDIMELAPNVYLTLSSDAQAVILYANAATRTLLNLEPAAMLDRSLWTCVHPEDQPALSAAVSTMALVRGVRYSNDGGSISLPCRIRTAFDVHCRPMQASLRYGLLGIECSLWPVDA